MYSQFAYSVYYAKIKRHKTDVHVPIKMDTLNQYTLVIHAESYMIYMTV